MAINILTRLLFLVFVPVFSLLSRVRKGEGALFPLAAILAYRYGNQQQHLLPQLAFGLVNFALMYALNDIHDAPMDIKDPSRKNAWSTLLSENQPIGYVVYAVQLLGFGLLVFMFGLLNFHAFVGANAVAIAYNLGGKSLPIVDTLLVCLWGPAFVLMMSMSVPWPLVVIVGLMLGISHLFQMERDKNIDSENKINTLVTRLPAWQLAAFLAASFACCLFFYKAGMQWAALTCAATIVMPLIWGFRSRVWNMIKIVQAISWALALAL